LTFRKFAKVFGLTCTVLAAGIMAIQILSEPEPSAERPAWGPLIGGEGHFDDQPVIGCPTADPWKDYKSRNVMTGEVYWQRVMAPAGCRLFIARGARGTFKVRDREILANLVQICWPSGECWWVMGERTVAGKDPGDPVEASAPVPTQPVP
jgi:hypothetical protein